MRLDTNMLSTRGGEVGRSQPTGSGGASGVSRKPSGGGSVIGTLPASERGLAWPRPGDPAYHSPYVRTTFASGNRTGPSAGLLNARVAVFVCLALHCVAVRDAAAQDLPVENEVRSALEALNAGRIDEYLSHFLEGARVLIAYHEDDGGGIEVHPEDVRASLSKLTWAPETSS